MDEISNTNYNSQKPTLTLVIAPQQILVNHKPALSRNCSPGFYNSFKPFTSCKTAVRLQLWSTAFYNTFCQKLNLYENLTGHSWGWKNKEDCPSPSDGAQLGAVVYMQTSPVMPLGALQCLRGDKDSVQGEGHPSHGWWPRVDLKPSSFLPGLTQQCRTASRLTAVSAVEHQVGWAFQGAAQLPVCCSGGMWITPEEGSLLLNVNKL